MTTPRCVTETVMTKCLKRGFRTHHSSQSRRSIFPRVSKVKFSSRSGMLCQFSLLLFALFDRAVFLMLVRFAAWTPGPESHKRNTGSTPHTTYAMHRTDTKDTAARRYDLLSAWHAVAAGICLTQQHGISGGRAVSTAGLSSGWS